MNPLHLHVLVIEENHSLAANIFDYLEASGHLPDAAPDAYSVQSLATQNRCD
ncbi:DNA-binding response regulator, partial [Pseudomonas syringae pv. tagetis]